MKVICTRLNRHRAGYACHCSAFGCRKLAFGRSQAGEGGVLLGKQIWALEQSQAV